MTLDPETLRAVTDAFVADMDREDYCIGEKKVRLLLRTLGAQIACCSKCGDTPKDGLDFCQYCDPNRVPRRSIPNAGQIVAEAFEKAMKQPYHMAPVSVKSYFK